MNNDGKHGGPRPNSGRKPRAKKHESAILNAERRCADRLPQTIGNLENIADGSAEPEVEEEYAAAATITIEVIELVNDKQVKMKRLAFPDLLPDEMVLVRRKEKTFGPDVRANMYLADRAMGKPASGDEIKIQELVNAELNAFIEKIRSHFEPSVASSILEALANANPASSSAKPDAPG